MFVSSSSLAGGSPVRVAARRPGSRLAASSGNGREQGVPSPRNCVAVRRGGKEARGVALHQGTRIAYEAGRSGRACSRRRSPSPSTGPSRRRGRAQGDWSFLSGEVCPGVGCAVVAAAPTARAARRADRAEVSRLVVPAGSGWAGKDRTSGGCGYPAPTVGVLRDGGRDPPRVRHGCDPTGKCRRPTEFVQLIDWFGFFSQLTGHRA